MFYIMNREVIAMKIMYWSDYACPYCYIGETHLKKAIENLNLGDQMDIEMLAFEFTCFRSQLLVGQLLIRLVQSKYFIHNRLYPL